jgi:hypothetical protein
MIPASRVSPLVLTGLAPSHQAAPSVVSASSKDDQQQQPPASTLS